MTKLLVFKEKSERSPILQEIWRWRYNFLICCFLTFLGLYIMAQTGKYSVFIIILNYLGYYVGIETMGYLRDKKSLDMYMSLPCSMRRTFARKLTVSAVLAFVAILIGILIGFLAIDNWDYYNYETDFLNECYKHLISLDEFKWRYIYEPQQFDKIFNMWVGLMIVPVFFYSFTCGVVGSIITPYVSAAIVTTVFTKYMLLPITILLATWPLYNFIPIDIKVLEFMLFGDLGASEICEYWWLNFVYAAVNVCIAVVFIGMVKAERATRLFLSTDFAKIILYFLIYAAGLLFVYMDDGFENRIIGKFVVVAVCFGTYYLIKFIFRNDIKTNGIPWFLIVYCALCVAICFGIDILENMLMAKSL